MSVPSRVPTELLVTNGRIWTGSEHDDATLNEVSALVISDGAVVAIGTSEELQSYEAHASRVIDLRGHRVLPGLIDSHMHAVRAGLTWSLSLHWDELRTLEEGMAQLRDRADHLAPGEWITVTGSGTLANLLKLDCRLAPNSTPSRPRIPSTSKSSTTQPY